MLRLNSLSASGMRYGRLRTKRLACSRMSQPLDTAVCAVSCALDTMSAIILVSFLVREVVARFLRAFFIVHELVGCVPSCGFSGCFGLFFGPCVFGLVGWGVR